MKTWPVTRAVAAKEWLELWRDGRLRLGIGLVLALLLVALAGGWREHRNFQREVAVAARADREAWLGQGARNPHSAAHFGQYAFRPSTLLSALDPGVDAFVGNAIWLEAHYQDPARHRAAEDQGSLARLARPTFAFLLQNLIPLLLALLAFGAIAGERELGTWRQAIAQGASARGLVLGKLLAIFSVVALPLAAAGAAVLALTLAAGFSADGGPPGALPRLLVMALGYALFLLGFLGVALAVSAWSANRRTALLALLGWWIASCLVLPRVAADFTEKAFPVPAPAAFWDQVRADQSEGIDGHSSSDQRSAELERKVLAQYGVARTEDLPLSFEGIALQAGEEYGNQVFDRRWGEVWDAYQRQERVQSWVGALAPVLAVRGISMAMAGTDLFHHRHFTRAAEDHRRVINKQLNDVFARSAGAASFSWKADPALWKEVPPLDYRPPGFAAAAAPRVPELLILAFWALLGPWLACRAADRANV